MCSVTAFTNAQEQKKESKPSLQQFIEKMPKVDLHVHLEGAIQPRTLLELARRNHITLPAMTEKGLHEFFQFKDFDHFIKVYTTITSCLKTANDYELIAYEFGRDCHAQNVLYAEVTFTMETNCQLSGLSWHTILEALNKGRLRTQNDFGVTWQWVFDIVRDYPETQQKTLAIVKESKEKGFGIIALGLTGHEDATEPAVFAETFTQAREIGIMRTIHAGELSGPESIWSALSILHANRIGHGVHAIDDSQLMKELCDKQIPLEICPTSNISIGIYKSYEQHPLKKLWDAGLCITVNDDDPALFNTNMNQEYMVLVEHFGFNKQMLEHVSLNGIQASFLPKEQKQVLEEEFRRQFERLDEELTIQSF